MRQEAFRAAGSGRWEEIQRLLDALDRGKTDGAERFPGLYRRLCHDVAVARDRHFDAPLVERLNSLALRAHQRLYRTPVLSLGRIARFLRLVLPRSVRGETAGLLLSALLFFGSGTLVGFLVQRDPSLVYAIVSQETVSNVERMYDPSSETFSRPPTGQSRFEMFGYYVKNNVTICLRTFVGGALFGVGSLLILLYNGLVLGAVTGHLVRAGFGGTYFPFVVGHSGPELLAVLLCAVGGFRLGWALLSPGRYSRAVALRLAARGSLPLVYGSVGLLVVAACIEAFWSAYPLPETVKFAVGSSIILLLAVYFATSGRRHGA